MKSVHTHCWHTLDLKRILAVDYGDARTGLAISDLSCTIANGICTVKAEGVRSLIKKILETVKPYDISLIIVGNPVNMDDTYGPRSEKATAFAKKLERESGIKTIMTDERCTTVEAYEIMDFTNTRGKKRKAAVDTLSAEIILQDFLSLGNEAKENLVSSFRFPD